MFRGGFMAATGVMLSDAWGRGDAVHTTCFDPFIVVLQSSWRRYSRSITIVGNAAPLGITGF
jgi:hypothetical protein